MAIKPWCVIFPSEMLNKSNFLSAWAIATNQSQQVFGLTLGGEFSTAINDCGLWYVCIFLSDDNAEGSSDTSLSCRLSGIGSTPSSPDCAIWDDWAVCIITIDSTCPWPSNLIHKSYNASTIVGLKDVTLASMDALQNTFFWTWKIGNSTALNTSSCPLWHYRLGLQRGWIPKGHYPMCPCSRVLITLSLADPREATGFCASALNNSQIFNGSYPSTATGGVSAYTITKQSLLIPSSQAQVPLAPRCLHLTSFLLLPSLHRSLGPK